MFHFRALNVLAAGIGCVCLSSLDKWRRNTFKVNAMFANVPVPQYNNDAMVCELMKHGVPKRDVVLSYHDIQVSYDNRNKVPNWVLEHLTHENLTKVNVKQLGSFTEEEEIYPFYRATAHDYSTLEGMHRVRLACGKNHRYSQESYDATLKLTTVCPQNDQLNERFWNDLDAYMRYLTYHYKDVYIFTGPLFLLNEDAKEMEYDLVSRNLIGYPTHFFKLVIGRREDGGYDMGCYFLANEPIADADTLSQYRIPLVELEDKAGFRMFRNPATKNEFGCLLDVQDFRKKRRTYMEQAGLRCVM